MVIVTALCPNNVPSIKMHATMGNQWLQAITLGHICMCYQMSQEVCIRYILLICTEYSDQSPLIPASPILKPPQATQRKSVLHSAHLNTSHIEQRTKKPICCGRKEKKADMPRDKTRDEEGRSPAKTNTQERGKPQYGLVVYPPSRASVVSKMSHVGREQKTQTVWGFWPLNTDAGEVFVEENMKEEVGGMRETSGREAARSASLCSDR